MLRLRTGNKRALAVGLIQGPAELLPISSSAHTTLLMSLVPGWQQDSATNRKALELAMHGVSAIAIAQSIPQDYTAAIYPLTKRKLGFWLAATTPAALVGYLFRSPIERYLSSHRSLGLGAAAGALLLLPIEDGVDSERIIEELDWRDGLYFGFAQLFALIPGVSRLGATLYAANCRGFGRKRGFWLSHLVGLPLIMGAFCAEAVFKRRSLTQTGSKTATLIATVATSISATVCARLLRRSSELPNLKRLSLYRIALGLTLIVTSRSKR